jgi:WhiB family transcriptional regulator, redox-sensing transcriptional regulator
VEGSRIRAGSFIWHEGAVMANLGWMKLAACRGSSPDIFFPEDASGLGEARRICARCSVSSECLDYSLEKKISQGVWGGASERDRRAITRRRARRKSQLDS